MVLACLCTYVLLCGCAQMPAGSRPPPSSFLASRSNQPPFEIGVLSAGWHTGLVLPTGELGPLRPLLQRDPNARYVSVGWGNRRFYMATHPGSGDAIAALFRSPSALFVQEASAPAALSTAQTQIRWVCADRDELWRVVSYVEASLRRPDGKPVDLGPGPLPESRFYASLGHYSAVHTCNTWTIAALQYAGLPAHAGGVIFASQAGRRIRALRACPPLG
jgi:uncharacterized protein (TIGR02117 family)